MSDQQLFICKTPKGNEMMYIGTRVFAEVCFADYDTPVMKAMKGYCIISYTHRCVNGGGWYVEYKNLLIMESDILYIHDVDYIAEDNRPNLPEGMTYTSS